MKKECKHLYDYLEKDKYLYIFYCRKCLKFQAKNEENGS